VNAVFQVKCTAARKTTKVTKGDGVPMLGTLLHFTHQQL
jgi:hypothetical protein